jgi:hypothetical protein
MKSRVGNGLKPEQRKNRTAKINHGPLRLLETIIKGSTEHLTGQAHNNHHNIQNGLWQSPKPLGVISRKHRFLSSQSQNTTVRIRRESETISVGIIGAASLDSGSRGEPGAYTEYVRSSGTAQAKMAGEIALMG